MIAYADVWWMLALGLVALWYSLQYNILLQAVPHDTTFHIYAAQQILDGHAIYRDVAIIKAPLADFVTAFALVIARLVRISDVMGARLMSLAVVVATTSVTYLAGRVLFHARAAGVVAGLVMAGWDFYGLRSVTGPEPKAFLILFALIAIICIAQKRWGWAGATAALAALSWQPGLMIAAIAAGAALVTPWIEPTTFRLRSGHAPDERRTTEDRGPAAGEAFDYEGWQDTTRERGRVGTLNFLRVMGGLAVPFVLLIVYLAANNALGAAWNATIGANVTHLNATQARTPLPQMISANYAEILAEGGQYCFSPLEDWLVIGGTLGFLGMALAEVVYAVRGRRLPITLDRTPLLLYALGFAGFTLIDYDFCPDLFPLYPVLALSVGWLGWTVARGVGTLAARRAKPEWLKPARVAYLVSAVLAAIVLYVYILDARAYRVTGMNFQDQLDVAVAASAYLLPNDHVLSFGDAIVPVTLHLRNSTKILHLGSKSGLGVLASEPGGMQGMLDALDRDPPKLVSLSRESFPEWSKPFYDWLERRYEPGEIFPRANIRFFHLKQ